jgi:hypothetical protein
MSEQAKIASLIVVTLLAIELVPAIAFLTFGLEPLMVLLEDAGLILGVFALPAALAALLLAYLRRLTMS